MSHVSPVGIESVTYGVEDLDLGNRFFEEFGLARAERGQHGVVFTTPEGTSVQLRTAGDAALPPPIEVGPTMREVVWGVESKEALEALAAELSTDREVKKGPDGAIRTHDPNGVSIAFRVTHRKKDTGPPTPQTPRLNARAKVYDRAMPDHIGHVVFFTPKLKESVDFYTQRLGFYLSDTITNLGVFLRCSPDHHNLFFINHERKGLNHLAFRVNDFDEIMGGKDFLEGKGWRPIWGPGRHVVGSNLFYYFRNPCGGAVEYYADLDCITDPELWEPRDWTPGPGTFAAWGPPPPEEMLR